jgi:hypothetical protein
MTTSRANVRLALPLPVRAVAGGGFGFVPIDVQRLVYEPLHVLHSMFYDKAGKHVHTKKEITRENGQISPSCTIIKKGEVYESNMFSVKDIRFKQEGFVAETKKLYTSLIVSYHNCPAFYPLRRRL